MIGTPRRGLEQRAVPATGKVPASRGVLEGDTEIRRTVHAPTTRPLFAAAIAAVAALALAACGSSSSSGTSSSGGSAAGGYGSATPKTTTTTAAAAPTAASGGSTVNLTADPGGALKFNTTTLTAKSGKVTVVMKNPSGSGLQHGIAVEGNGVDKDGPTVQPGGTSTDTVTLKPGRTRSTAPFRGTRLGTRHAHGHMSARCT